MKCTQSRNQSLEGKTDESSKETGNDEQLRISIPDMIVSFLRSVITNDLNDVFESQQALIDEFSLGRPCEICRCFLTSCQIDETL